MPKTEIKKLQNINKIKLIVFGVVLIVAAAATIFGFHKFHKQVSSAEIVKPDAANTAIPGWWYQQYFKSSVCNADNCKPAADPDKDGLTNQQEYFYHSDPLIADTNKNGLNDGEDVAHNYDPSKPGKVSMDASSLDTQALGDGLVFGEDVKKMLNQEIDPNNVALPQVSDSEINISNDNSKQAIANYVKASNDAVAKYFPSNRDQFISDAMKSGDETRIADVQSRFQKALNDLKQMPVPSKLAQAHKYLISFLTLLPDVLNVPTQAEINDSTNVQSNSWFDKTQAAFVLYQKLQLEINNIQSK